MPSWWRALHACLLFLRKVSLTLLPEEFVSRAIKKGAPFWTPGLARLLVNRFWAGHGDGFSASTYGSFRWISSDPLACRSVVSIIDLPGAEPLVVEALPDQVRQQYKSFGLQFRSDSPSSKDLKLFRDAFASLRGDSGLFDTTVRLVRSVHLLAESRQGYDTSHSDPDLPCSIFLSIPSAQEPSAELRLAESIVHEAMHLQLTMLEKEVPLVCDAAETGYSPWQCTERPINGLLHGLFVFSVIYQWLTELRTTSLLGLEEDIYVSKRRREIANEIAIVSELVKSPALTRFGRTLVTWLLGARSYGLNASPK